MPELDYRALNRRAQTEMKRQKSIARWVFFVVSLFIFLLFLGFGWAFFSQTNLPTNLNEDELKVAGMIMLTTGGGLVLMFQFLSTILETSAGEASMRGKIMARLVAEEVMRLGAEDEGLDQDKAKRMMISDEGELEDIVDEVEQEQRYISKK